MTTAVRPPDVFLVGYPRTGTNLLVRIVLPALGPRCHQIGKAELVWDDRPLRYADDVSEETHRAAADSDRMLVYARPAISGDMYNDDPASAEKIARFNRDARIVISVRSQYTIARGLYLIALKQGFRGSFRGYCNLIVRNGKLNYLALYRHYIEVFGNDRVTLNVLEEISRGAAAYLNEIASAISGSQPFEDGYQPPTVASSPDDPIIVLYRWANAMRLPGAVREPLVRIAHILNKRVAGTVVVKPFGKALRVDRRQLEGAYAAENRALFDLLGKDIDFFDYPGSRRAT